MSDLSSMPTVAIVGRPNVGKSALFNRLVGRNISIVHDQPGVTRDRIASICKLTCVPVQLIDTGGIGAALEDGFAEQVTAEADMAMETADLILFVVDSRDGVTSIDDTLAKRLRRTRTPVILVANKVDSPELEKLTDEFAALGFDCAIGTSAEHGRGMSELLDAMDAYFKHLIPEDGLPDDDEETAEAANDTNEDDKRLKIAIVGRPNVGKSSLINAILKDARTIVSDVAGTTRDAIDVPYSRGEDHYTLIDTAGLRQRQKMDTSVEVFSAMRTERSIRRADLCLLVIDASAGVTAMDRKIANVVLNEKKACIIVVNKWDLFEPDRPDAARQKKLTERVRKDLFFLHYAPLLWVSAKENLYVEKIFGAIQRVKQGARQQLGTGALNRLLQQSYEMNQPAVHKKFKKRLKLLYATTAVSENYSQIPVPTYIVFVNDKRLLHESYEHYLGNRIKEKLPSPGIPVVFSFRSRNRGKDDLEE